MSFEINNRSNVYGPLTPLRIQVNIVEETNSSDLLIIEERNSELKSLEKDLEDLLASHRILSSMISEQGEDLEVAEENIIHVNEKVVDAVEHLENAANLSNKKRRTGIFAVIGGTSGGGIGAIGFVFGPHVGIVTTLLALGIGAATGAIISTVKKAK